MITTLTTMTNIWYFVCHSDMQYNLDHNTISGRYLWAPKQILNLNKTIDFEIIAGDMTEHGYDSHTNLASNEGNEFEAFLNYYMKPIEKKFPVYMCIGNHDINMNRSPNMEIFKYIRDKYHATYSWTDYMKSSCYTFEHNGILFISLGLYPYNIEWLKSILPKDKSKPIIIFYHYNTKKGEPWSDWWNEKEKETFFKTIEGCNVILIINGHNHQSHENNLNGIQNLLAADEPVLVTMLGSNVKEMHYIKENILEQFYPMKN